MAEVLLPGLGPKDPRNLLADAARRRISDAHADADLIRTRALAAIETRYRSDPDAERTFLEYLHSGEAAIEWAQARLGAGLKVLTVATDEFRAAGKSGQELRSIMRQELYDAVISLELTTIQRDVLWQELRLDRYNELEQPLSEDDLIELDRRDYHRAIAGYAADLAAQPVPLSLLASTIQFANDNIERFTRLLAVAKPSQVPGVEAETARWGGIRDRNQSEMSSRSRMPQSVGSMSEANTQAGEPENPGPNSSGRLLDHYYLTPPVKVKLERTKAEGLIELRPFLERSGRDRPPGRYQGLDSSREVDEAASLYIKRIVEAHLRCLVESDVLPNDLNIDSFVDHAITDARRYANDAHVDRSAIASRARLADWCRLAYLTELQHRVAKWARFPIHSEVLSSAESEKNLAELEAEYASSKEEHTLLSLDVRSSQKSDSAETPGTGDSEVARANKGENDVGGGTDSGGVSWRSVEISFTSEERVQIRNGVNMETRNYSDFGFADGRTGKPNQAWMTLRIMAEHNGIIQDGAKLGMQWPQVEKQIQGIRKVLRKHFGIEADPIPFTRGSGYQSAFKVRCAPSYAT